jgi:hypothetical protein
MMTVTTKQELRELRHQLPLTRGGLKRKMLKQQLI